MRGKMLGGLCLLMAWAQGCGGDTGEPAKQVEDTGAKDASLEDGSTLLFIADGGEELLDAAPGADTVFVDQRCSVGTARNRATTGTLDIFGHITYFADGADLPAGTYRVVYEDGCMKYGDLQDWTVQAYPPPSEEYAWFVGSEVGVRRTRAPGTAGIAVGSGAFLTFDECVAANLLLKPIAFRHAGGRLGVWLSDSEYRDNNVGVDDRNPRWRLERVDCDPDAGPL